MSKPCEFKKARWPNFRTTAVLLLLAALPISEPALAQGPAAQSEFSFVVIGHLRGARDNKPYFMQDELVAEVAALQPDLIVFTGDMIWGDWFQPGADPGRITAHWDRFDAAWGELGAPIFRVPGNHDINDPVTRDIYFDRYGELPQAMSFGNSRFLLLATPFIPHGDPSPSVPRGHARGTELSEAQIDFLKDELAQDSAYEHAFVFMHHVLWWSGDSPWWTHVEPVLKGSKVRGVFAGDFGPSKFSHLQANAIDYFHSAVSELKPPDEIYTAAGRALNLQFDNYLHVTVRGQDVDVEVRTFGATTSGRHSPQYWDTAFTAPAAAKPTLMQQFRNFLGGPRRIAFLLVLLACAFALGAMTTLWWLRRSRNR